MSGPDAVDQAEYWNVSGTAWVRFADVLDRHTGPYGDAAIAALAPARGARLLDIGCGCGATTLELARRVGPHGAVTGVDLSAPMLDLARRRAADAGIRNVAFVEGDAGAAPLAELAGGALDGALSRFGVMFFPDPVAGFANVAVALRPGARLAAVVWQDLNANPWWTVPVEAATGALGPMSVPTSADEPGPFSLADPGRVRSVLGSAGFVDVALEATAAGVSLRDGHLDQDAAEALQAGPMRRLWEPADDGARAAAVAAVREAIAPYRVEGGYFLPGAAWVVTASSA